MAGAGIASYVHTPSYLVILSETFLMVILNEQGLDACFCTAPCVQGIIIVSEVPTKSDYG